MWIRLICLKPKKKHLNLLRATTALNLNAFLSLRHLILEYRSAVDWVVNEQRNAENQGDQAKKVELSTRPSNNQSQL